MSPPDRSASPKALHATVLLVIVAAGGVLRALASRGDLWLDEIWSVLVIEQLGDPWQVVTRFRHDNNHVLNSLLIRALGGGRPDWVYRVPAVLAGTLLVAAAGFAARLAEASRNADRRIDGSARLAGLLAAALFAGSALFVQYGSEARGYALAALFTVTAVALALGGDAARASRWAVAYWAAAILAFVSHPLGVHAMAAVLPWSLVRQRQARGRDRLAAALWWHAVPLAALAIYYAAFLRHMLFGGGAESSVPEAVAAATAFTLGLPQLGTVFVLGTLGVVVAAGLLLLRRDGSDLVVLYAVGIVISPALALTLEWRGFVFPRYFLVNAAFLLLLVAQVLAATARRGAVGRLACALVLGGMAIGSGSDVAQLLEQRRGAYSAALREIARATPEGPILVAGDHDFRVGLVIDYHAARLGLRPRLAYVRAGERRAQPPEWYIEQRARPGPVPAETGDGEGNRYRLTAQYPSAPLSGFQWYVFRRSPGTGH